MARDEVAVSDTIEHVEASSEKAPHVHEGNLREEIDPRAIGGDLSQLPKGYYKTFSFIGTFAACALGMSCSNATFVMPINILTIINEDLGPSPHYWWINLVWILSSCVMYGVGGRLSDILGRRWFFILGNGFGTIGAIVASRTTTVNTLIGANTLIGIAAAVQQSWPMALAELVPNKVRGYVTSIVWISSIPFSVFSPVIARSLLQTPVGWRGCYYIAIALTSLNTLLFFLFYHPPTFELLHVGRKKTLRSILHMVDFGGTFLFCSGMIVFLLGINWGGVQYPWKSGPVIGCIIGGAVILIIFVLYELYYEQPYPLVPMRLFKRPGYTALVLGGAVVTLNYYNLSLLWPMQSSVLFGGSLLHIGWLSCATGGGTMLGDILVSALIRPIKWHRWMFISLACVSAIFTMALAAVTRQTEAMAIVFIIITGFGVGGVEAMVYTLSPLTCDPEDIGLATGVALAIRTSAPCIATSIYSTVLGNKLSVNIPKYVGRAATKAGLPGSELPELLAGFTTGSFKGISGLTPKILEAAESGYQEAYTQVFRLIYLSTIAWGAMGILAAIFTRDMGDTLNNFVGRKLQGKEITELSRDDAVKRIEIVSKE